MKKWLNHVFESSSGLTPEFAAFSRQMRSYLKKHLSGFDLVSYSRGHFYFSAFVRNKITGRLAYINSSDVRFFPLPGYTTFGSQSRGLDFRVARLLEC